MSAYILIWPITTVALALSVMLHRAATGRPDVNLRRCLWAAGAAVTVSFAASWFLGEAQGLWPNAMEPGVRIYIYVVLMQAIWFSYLFSRAIQRMDQAELFLRLFAFAGLALIVESMVFVYLRIPSPGGLALDGKTGRFQSLFFSSFDDVGFFMILAFASMLHVALTRRSLFWFIAAAACVLPIIGTFERAPLVGLLCSGAVVFLATRRRKLRWILVLAPGALGVAVLFAAFSEGIAGLLGGSVRQDYASIVTFWYRFALWLRGFEIGVAAFPWGVGPGMVGVQMSCPAMYLVPGNRFMEQNAPLWETYDTLVRGTYQSSAHNLFLTLFSENGLLGALTVMLAVAGFLRSLFLLLRIPVPSGGESRRVYLVWTCACSALAGLGVMYIFEMRLTTLFLILPLLHLCSLGSAFFRQKKTVEIPNLYVG